MKKYLFLVVFLALICGGFWQQEQLQEWKNWFLKEPASSASHPPQQKQSLSYEQLEEREKQIQTQLQEIGQQLEEMKKNLLSEEKGNLKQVIKYATKKENLEQELQRIRQQQAEFSQQQQQQQKKQRQEEIVAVQQRLKQKAQEYSKIRNSSASQEEKKQAWQKLVSACPEFWQAQQVQVHDLSRLLTPPQQRELYLMAVKGPSQVKMGERVRFRIYLKNVSALTLKGAVLKARFPPIFSGTKLSEKGFLKQSLGPLRPGEMTHLTYSFLVRGSGNYPILVALLSGQKFLAKAKETMQANEVPPPEWPKTLWQACWQGQWIDFTQDQWQQLPASRQANYAQVYQEWYAQMHHHDMVQKREIAGNQIDFVLIPPGEFFMGSPPQERGRSGDEKRHQVVIREAFWMTAIETPQSLWQGVTGRKPWQRKQEFPDQADYPATFVSWNDIQKQFLAAIAPSYSLPTEAQWEYALRAGTTSAFPWGNEITAIDQYANTKDQSASASNGERILQVAKDNYPKIAPPRQFRANGYGLFDMLGNVAEWCQDWYELYPTDNKLINPTGPPSGTTKVVRGGSWYEFRPSHFRSAHRNHISPEGRGDDLGFRIVAVFQVR